MTTPERQTVIVVDLGYGDAGKGTITDFLARHHRAHTVVRYNGGAQAAHNVITPDGRHHTFAQFGSATFLPGVKTHLSQFMLVEPYAMLNEEAHLREVGVSDAFARTTLDRRARIITPYQQAANRLREIARGKDRHGSCGVGIGETVADGLHGDGRVLLAGELPDQAVTKKKLRFLRDAKREELADIRHALRNDESAARHLAVFEDDEIIAIAAENYAYLAQQITLTDADDWQRRVQQPGTMIFEGAQGVLLDEDYGFAPYNTWSKTTTANALDLLADYDGEITRLGVLRTYATRHGAGPFVTEDTTLIPHLPEPHNLDSSWQQTFRRGYFDVLAARYALQACGQIDALALTHVDRVAALPEHKLCTAYQFEGNRDQIRGYFARGHFAQAERTITSIDVQETPDQAHQETLSQRLFLCKPLYEQVKEQDYVRGIADRLGLRLLLTSHGPTAADKTLHDFR